MGGRAREKLRHALATARELSPRPNGSWLGIGDVNVRDQYPVPGGATCLGFRRRMALIALRCIKKLEPLSIAIKGTPNQQLRR